MERKVYNRTNSGGGIHIRIQGRRTTDRDSSPVISVRRFGDATGRSGLLHRPTTLLNQPPNVTQKQFEGTPIRINHIITDSPPHSPTRGTSRRCNSPSRVSPPIIIRQRQSGYPGLSRESLFRRDPDDVFASRFQRLKQAIFTEIPADSMDYSDTIFDSIEKEFDRFTRESESLSKRDRTPCNRKPLGKFGRGWDGKSPIFHLQ